jgi:hypothetical protein
LDDRADLSLGNYDVRSPFLSTSSLMAVIGPFHSAVARAEVSMLQNAPNPFALITPSVTNPCLTRRLINGLAVPLGLMPPCDFAMLHPAGNTKNYFFRVVANDYIEGKALAKLAYMQGYRKVYVVGLLDPPGTDQTLDYGLVLANSFTSTFLLLPGTTIVSPGSTTDVVEPNVQIGVFHPGTMTAPQLAATIVQAQPDLVFYGGDEQVSSSPGPLPSDLDYGGALKAAIHQQCRPPACSEPAMEVGDSIAGSMESRMAWTAGGQSLTAGNTFGLAYGRDPTLLPTTTGSFKRAFTAAYPTTLLTAYGVMAYDAAMLVIDQITRLITAHLPVTRKAVVYGLETSRVVVKSLYTSNYPAVSDGAFGGTINFSQGQDPPTADADIGDNLGPWPFAFWEVKNNGNTWSGPADFQYQST